MKLLISISANVLNQEAVVSYIKDLHTGQANIDRWLDKTLRVYLLNESKYHVKVSKPPKNAPEWAFKAKDLVNFKPSPQLELDLEHAIGWLRTFPESKVFNVAVEEAIKQGELHIERENKKASDKEGVIETLHTFKDGWKIVNLKDAQALKREGKIMQHCVGNEQQNYIKTITSGKGQIWSLRDPNNQPHCTMLYYFREKYVSQIKGKQNKGLAQKYHQYVQEWLTIAKRTNLVASVESDDLSKAGMIDDATDNLHDLYKLPAGFITKRNLDIVYTSPIPELPENLTVKNDFNATGTSITHLPKGFRVLGSAYLKECNSLKEVGDGFYVKGYAMFNDCTSLTTLPKDLKCGSRLFLNGCNSLEVLPPIKVKTEVQAVNCTSLKVVQKGFNTKTANFHNCHSLTDLPDGLSVERLTLTYCTSMTKLPKRLKVSTLNAEGCSNLVSIPDNLTVENAYFDYCTSLTSLPSGLKVADELTLIGCTGLTSLPEDLEAKSIHIKNCPNLTNIPSRLKPFIQDIPEYYED